MSTDHSFNIKAALESRDHGFASGPHCYVDENKLSNLEKLLQSLIRENHALKTEVFRLRIESRRRK